jgi:hypothetical protein
MSKEPRATPTPKELPEGHYNFSLNEPPGSNVGGEAETPPPELPALVLTSVDPVSAVISADPDVPLTVTGSGFDATCVVVFDDADLATAFVSETELTASAPMAAAPAVVDVEVHRGDDLSDVRTFEFTAVAGRASASTRKPKKPGKKGKR